MDVRLNKYMEEMINNLTNMKPKSVVPQETRKTSEETKTEAKSEEFDKVSIKADRIMSIPEELTSEAADKLLRDTIQMLKNAPNRAFKVHNEIDNFSYLSLLYDR